MLANPTLLITNIKLEKEWDYSTSELQNHFKSKVSAASLGVLVRHAQVAPCICLLSMTQPTCPVSYFAGCLKIMFRPFRPFILLRSVGRYTLLYTPVNHYMFTSFESRLGILSSSLRLLSSSSGHSSPEGGWTVTVVTRRFFLFLVAQARDWCLR